MSRWPDRSAALMADSPSHVSSRKWWILHGLHAAGDVIIDEGAYMALTRRDSGGRLLAAGVVGVSGSFASQQAVRVIVRRRRRRPSLPPVPYDVTRSLIEALSLSGTNPSSPRTHAITASPTMHASLGNPSFDSPLLSVTAPATPNILPALSLSSSIASLDPLSRSNPVSPALAPLREGVYSSIGGAADAAANASNGQPHGEMNDDESAWEEVEVGKGQANFNSSEIERIKGLRR